MAHLTVEDLGKEIQFAEEDVDLPELGGTVRVRQLSTGRRARLRKGIVNGAGDITDLGEFEIRMFVAGLCDPKVTKEQALIWKEQWPGSMWDRVILAITKLGDTDAEEVERVAAEEFQDADD